MKNVKVLGPGCSRCMRTADMVQAEADRLGIPVTIEKVTDLPPLLLTGSQRRPASWSTAD